MLIAAVRSQRTSTCKLVKSGDLAAGYVVLFLVFMDFIVMALKIILISGNLSVPLCSMGCLCQGSILLLGALLGSLNPHMEGQERNCAASSPSALDLIKVSSLRNQSFPLPSLGE